MDATFRVGVAFFAFVGLLLYLKVPAMVTAILDKRTQDTSDELDRARALREEAQALLASYQRKQRDAEKEAETIVEQANAEAERLTAETTANLEEELQRRSAIALEKISQAEAQAVADVRDFAVDVATSAARRVVTEQVKGDLADKLIDDSIAELSDKLH